MTSPDQTTDGCADCSPALIEEVACDGRRIERMAEVSAEKKAELDGFRTSYATARNDYAAARTAAMDDVEGARTQLEAVRQRLRCLVPDGDRECLKEAYTRVRAEIVACAGEPGCCTGDCTVDDTVPPDTTIAALAGRIAHYRQQYDSAAACFTSLLAEKTELPKRAAAVKAEVAAIAAAVAAEGSPGGPAQDYRRLYVRALVAQQALEVSGVYRGFADVAAYTDCLCSALLCALRTWAGVVKLEGAMAELVCRAEGAQATCIRIQEQTVDEVLTLFIRICLECTRHDHSSTAAQGHAAVPTA